MHFFNIWTQRNAYTNEEKLITYLNLNRDTNQNYIEYIEDQIKQLENSDNLQNFEVIMKNASENFLQKQIKRYFNHYKETIEPVWITKEIRRKISKRIYGKQTRHKQNIRKKGNM